MSTTKPPADVVSSLSISRQIIANANNQAAQLIQDAHVAVANLKDRAWEEGFSDGRRTALLGLLDLTELKKKLIKDSKESIVKLALDVAWEVIGTIQKLNPETIVIRVQRAIDQVLNASKIKIVVNPEDGRTVEENLYAVCSKLPQDCCVSMVEDENIDHGSVRLETDAGYVEGSLWKHFNAIKEFLFSRLG